MTRDRPIMPTILWVGFCCALAIVLYASYGEDMDFRMFYSAAQMVRHGAGPHLYDLEQQRVYQLAYTPSAGLVYNYPPPVAALYLPATLGPLRTGYLIWTVVNLAMLSAAVALLRPRYGPLAGSLYVPLLALCFGPTVFAFVQGQISVAVLLAYALAAAALRTGHQRLAGLAIAATLVKPQLAFPVLAVTLLQRRWKVVHGWFLGGLALCVASVMMSGWRVILDYPRFLARMPSVQASGITPAMMANARGLYFLAFGVEPSALLMAGVVLLVVALAARVPITSDRGFAVTAAASLLGSYHLNPHDLILLLIPLAVIAGEPRYRWLAIVLWAAPLAVAVVSPALFPLLLLVVIATWIACQTAGRAIPTGVGMGI